MATLPSPRQPLWCLPALFVLLTAAAAQAAPHITLGPADLLALDQPRVTFGLFNPGTNTLIGPQLYNTALLDTGANGILLANLAYIDDENYQQARRADNTPVYYNETGIAGDQWLEVYVPYDLVYSGGFGGGAETRISSVRAFGARTLNIGSFAAVVGMPAMVGRVVNLNLQPMADLDFIGVTFSAARPSPTSSSYHVNLSMLAPEFTGVLQPGDPTPTYSALPMIDGVKTAKGNKRFAGPMLLDTGAQTVIISTATAEALGIDYEHTTDEGGDVVDELEVGGVGGSTLIPLVNVEKLTIPTTEGVDLVWTDIVAGVVDIPGIGGVVGMNMLTSGYAGEILGGGSTTPYINKVILDFTNASRGVMRLDLNPAVNHVTADPTIPGDFNGDGLANVQDINPFVLALGNLDGYYAQFPDMDLSLADPNGDGRIDVQDINAFVNLLAQQGIMLDTAIIPEPSGMSLLLSGTLWMLLHRP
ncbi:MAG: retroviral-like aspartic protease family protein [Phycisphaeraceae bacterium]|nr:retroviral-like aspartic protease family protein [Phycisphaeraceae bacterium]